MKSRKTGWRKLVKKSLLSFFLKGRKRVRGRQSNSSSCCFSWLRCSSETVVTPSPSRVDSHAAAELQEYRVIQKWKALFEKNAVNCAKKKKKCFWQQFQYGSHLEIRVYFCIKSSNNEKITLLNVSLSLNTYVFVGSAFLNTNNSNIIEATNFNSVRKQLPTQIGSSSIHILCVFFT